MSYVLDLSSIKYKCAIDYIGVEMGAGISRENYVDINIMDEKKWRFIMPPFSPPQPLNYKKYFIQYIHFI